MPHKKWDGQNAKHKKESRPNANLQLAFCPVGILPVGILSAHLFLFVSTFLLKIFVPVFFLCFTWCYRTINISSHVIMLYSNLVIVFFKCAIVKQCPMMGTKLWYTIVSFGTHCDFRKLCSYSDLHSYPPMLYSLAVPSLKRKYCHFLFFFFTFLNFPLAPVQIMKTLPKAQRTCFCKVHAWIITSYAYSIDVEKSFPFVL